MDDENEDRHPTLPPRVSVRPVTAEDLPTLFAFESEERANEMALAVPRTAEEFDAHWKKILGQPSVLVLAVESDDELAGSVVCFEMQGHYYAGYWIGEAYWGRGVATRALRLLLQRVAFRPLFARVSTSNHASIRVLQKCGFLESHRELGRGNARFLESEIVVMKLEA
ncbi:MAG: GNAT family N-acetyltransferase [Planctomycetota bacterium]